MNPESPIPSIGAELVRAADEWKRTTAEILTELFPYIYEASRRMSTRAIGRWLEETHGIKISQATISRSLRNPDKFWIPFAELMEPHARTVEHESKATMADLMTSHRVFEWTVESFTPQGETPAEAEANRDEFLRAVQYLREHWFCLSETTRAHMNHYFRDLDADEENSQAEEATK